MVIRELIKEISEELKKSGNDNPVFEAYRLAAYALGSSQQSLIASREKSVPPQDASSALSLAQRRASGEPLQYILGTQEFMSLNFIVTPDVLIPRQDTETLTELILQLDIRNETSLLDIGTGTGCIPVSLLKYNENLICTGIDISEDALTVAKTNAELLGVSDRITLKKTDIMAEIPDGQYDIVVSNPPYIKSSIIPSLQKEVREHEPISPLDGGIDGLDFYRRICGISREILKPKGFIAFEIGFDQASDVSEIMSGNFEDIKVTKDLCGNDRVVTGILK